jgi:predicted MFS family arabinose efflux permease
MQSRRRRSPSWNVTLAILCTVTAIAVSVIYLPQPLLRDLARTLSTTATGASSIATAVQLGYAVGIFLLVPLADRLQPRRQITLQLLFLTLALAGTSLLPTVGSVAAGFLAVGIVANVAQLIIPVALRLAPQTRKHSTTGALVSSLLIGIFGGRIAASLLVGDLGWRGVALAFAGLVLLMVPFVRKALPAQMDATTQKSYPRLLGSTLRRIVISAPLRESSIMQFFGFALFNSIWTVMVLHLTGQQFGWTVAEAGLFGLVGLAAGFVTPFAGSWIQRFGATRIMGIFLAVLVLATASIIVDSGQIWLFGASVFLLTWANQVLQSTNQSRSLIANPDGPAQANTIFMVSVFFGGSLGAILGPIAFEAGGMPAVALQGVVFACAFAITWVASVRRQRRHRLNQHGAVSEAQSVPPLAGLANHESSGQHD